MPASLSNVVAAVQQVRGSLTGESSRNLLVTRAIREELRLQTPILQAIAQGLKAKIGAIGQDFRGIPNRLEIKNLSITTDTVVLKAKSVVVTGEKQPTKADKEQGKEIADAIAEELKRIKPSGGFGNPLQTVGTGLLLGIGAQFGVQFARGFEKEIQKNWGFSFRKTGQVSGKAVSNPVGAGQDLITARRSERITNKAVEEARRQAEQESVKIDPNRLNIFAVGGLFGLQGRGSVKVARQIETTFGKSNVNAIPVENSASDTDVKKGNQFAIATDMYAKQFQNLFGRGYNPDAVKLAAKVMAARKQNPQAAIDLIGYCQGGMIVEEALAILEKAGINDVRGLGLGTPNLGLGLNQKNFKRILGKNDKIRQGLEFLETDTSQQSLSDFGRLSQLGDHKFSEYLVHPETIKALPKEMQGLGIQALIGKHFQLIQNSLKEISAQSDQSQKSKIVEDVKKEIEQIKSALAEFSVEGIQELISAYDDVLSTLEGFDPSINLNEVKSEITTGADKIEASVRDKYLIYLDRLIQSAQAQAEDQIRAVIPNYSSLTIPQKRQFATQFTKDINEQARRFRTAVAQNDKQLAAELGENLLTKIQSIKKIYNDLLTNLPEDYSGRRSLQGSLSSLNRLEGEILSGDRGKGRAGQGLSQIVQESSELSDDVSRGFIEGINDKLKEIEAAGVDLGEAAIQGAKERLKIASPSRVFIQIGEEVVEGFIQGLDKLGSQGDSIRNFLGSADESVAGFVDKAGQKINSFFGSLTQQFPILEVFKELIISVFAGMLIGNAIESLVGAFNQLANASFTAVLEFESMERAMLSITGSSEEAARGLEFVRKEAKRLGVDLRTTEQAYNSFRAATKNTALSQGQADKIFATFAETASLRGLGNEEQANMFRALNQIISKGKLSAEEVRGQLGEISGLSFQSTLARALGINSAQLDKALSGGELYATDVLPKVAAQYAAENSTISQSSETTQQSLNRLNNAILELKRSFAGWIAGSRPFFTFFANGIELLTKVMPGLIKATGALTATLFLDTTISLLSAFKGSATGALLMRNGLAALSSVLQAILPAILTFAKQFLLMSLAFDAVGNAISITQNAFPELQKDIQETTNRVNALRTALENLGKTKPNLRPDLPKNERDIGTSKTWNFLGIQTPLNLEPVRRGLGLTTLGEKELNDFRAGVGDLLTGIDNNLFEGTNVAKVLEQVKELDKQLTQLRSRRFNIPAGNRDAYQASIEQEQKLLEKRDQLLKATGQFQQNLESDKANVVATLQLLDELAAKKGITAESESAIRAQLENRLSDIDKVRKAFEDSASSLAKSVNALEIALRNLNEQSAYFNENLERRTAGDKTKIINQGLRQGEGSQVVDLRLQQIDLQTLQTRLTFIRDQLAATNEYLAKPDFRAILTDLKAQARDQGLNLENTATIDRLIQENRSQQETAVLNTLKQQLTLKDQLAQTEQQLAEGVRSAENQVYETDKAIKDYFVQLAVQVRQAQVEVERLITQLKYGQIKSKLQRALVPGANTFVNNIINQIQGLFDQAAQIAEQVFGNKINRINFSSEKYNLQAEAKNFARSLGGATEAVRAFAQVLQSIAGIRVQRFSTSTFESAPAAPAAPVRPATSSNSWQASPSVSSPPAPSPQPSTSPTRFNLPDWATELSPILTGFIQNLAIATDVVRWFTETLRTLQVPQTRTNLNPTGEPSLQPQPGTTSRPQQGRREQPGRIDLNPTGEPDLRSVPQTGTNLNPTGEPSLQPQPRASAQQSRRAKPSGTGYQGNPNALTPQQALIVAAEILGVSPEDLATLISIETGGTLSPSIRGGANNKYIGLIQFGPYEQRRYGANQRQTFQEQVLGPVVGFLQDRGIKPGMTLADMYRAVLTGNVRGNPNARDSFGNSVNSQLQRHEQAHRQRVRRWMNGQPRAEAPSYYGIALEDKYPEPTLVAGPPQRQQPRRQSQTDILIKAKERQLDLNDAGVRQQVNDYIQQLQQAREQIQREMADQMRSSQNTLIDLQQQFADLRAQYQFPTLSSQAEADKRNLQTQFRTFDNQLAEQERALQDNIRALDQLINQTKPLIATLKASANETDRQTGAFLESLIGNFERDKSLYTQQLQQVRGMRGQLAQTRKEAERFIKTQDEMRRRQSEMERLDQEARVAEAQNNLEKVRQANLAKSRRQLELDVLKAQQDFSDDPAEMQRRVELAKQEAANRERQIEYDYKSKKLQIELEAINQQIAIAQQNSNLERRRELELLQAQKQLELDILEIQNQFPANPAEQERRIRLAREQADLKRKEIEYNYQSGLLQRDLQEIEQEIAIAQQTNNLERLRELQLLQARKQLELDILEIKKQFPDDLAEQEERIKVAQEQARLKEQEIEYTYQVNALQRELDIISRQLAIAQSNSNLEKRRELALLQSKKQLELELLEIQRQYATNQEETARRTELANQEAQIRNREIEAQYQRDLLDRQQQSQDLDNQILNRRADLTEQYDPFGAADLRQRAAEAEEQLRYEREIQDYRNQYADDPVRADELVRKATILRDLNLENIDRQFKDLGETIQDVLANNFTTFFEDLLSGTKSVGEAFQDLAVSILRSIAQIAAQMAAQSLIRGVFGLFGGGFAEGGTIPNFAEGGPVREALRREGAKGVLAVFTPGEEILSLRTGEAQRYQSLKARLGKNPLKKINNFAEGGTVEGALLSSLAPAPKAIAPSRFEIGSGVVAQAESRQSTVNINVSTPDVAGFNRSQRQLGRLAAEYIRRS